MRLRSVFVIFSNHEAISTMATPVILTLCLLVSSLTSAQNVSSDDQGQQTTPQSKEQTTGIPGVNTPPSQQRPSTSVAGGPPQSSAAGSDKSSYIRPYPPPQPQFCPAQKPGFLNDRCDDKRPCYNDYSLECKDNKCVCRKNYIPSREKNGLCEPAPYLNQPCDKICQAPLVCKEGPVQPYPEYSAARLASDSGSADNATSAPETPTPGSAAAVDEAKPIILPPPPSPPPPPKICRCEPPYVLENGYTCRLYCKPDEWYDYNDAKCKPRCKAGEVKLEDGTCAKASKLGQRCKDNLQCIDQYAECTRGVCRCLPGFDQNNGKCVPKKYSCPWKEPLQDSNGNVMQCTKSNPTYPDYQGKDSCPKDAYCQTGDVVYYPDNSMSGFCCPKPSISCPEGDEIPNTSCTYPSPYPQKQCPYQTHYCYSVYVANGYSNSICCPKACDSNYIPVGGRCYPPLQYGDACEVDEQCRGFSGVCSDNNRTCSCPPNGEVQGSGDYKYCIIRCAPDEVLINQKCYKRLNLGDSCKGKPAYLCPDNAACDENGKCACLCQFIPLGNKRCGPYPVCRKTYYYPPYPIPLAAGSDASGQALGKQPPSTVAPPNDDQDNSTYEALAAGSTSTKTSYTFCRYNIYDKPPVPTVTKCPKGQYCNYYQSDFGLCCPIPDPICPNGSKGTKTCKPGDIKTCGKGYYCYEYFHAQGGSSPDAGYTCCPVTY